MKHRFIRYGLTFLLFLATLLLGFLYFYPVKSLFLGALRPSARIVDRNGVLLYETSRPDQGKTQEVPLAQLPPFLIQATLAAEDAHFYSHSGVDLTGILRALFQNMMARRVVSGGSTITQQLVRNVIGVNRERTVWQKIKESLLALRVERVFTKDEILGMYLNKIYYGHLNYGVASAAWDYFGKNVSDLDLAESAFLAGLPQSPNRYNPFLDPQAALQRKNYVLRLMREQDLISEEETREAQAEIPVFQSKQTSFRAPHFVHLVLEELETQFGNRPFAEGWEVTTTLDVHWYDRVQAIARRHVERLTERNVHNAAVVVLDVATGDVLALLGSPDYFDASIDGQVNNAVRLHQPGSTLKPITYAAAFEKGWNGATLIDDEPVRFFTAEGFPYFPKNYDYDFHGTVTVREALANSYNIPALKAIDFTGVEAVLEKARALGLNTLNESADHYGLALTLGDGEVRLLDLTNAYRVFAQQGMFSEPRFILSARDSDGETVFNAPDPLPMRVLSEAISFMITDILADNKARLPQFGPHSALQLNRPAAAKTGTTRSFRDNWTLGFTPDIVTGVWLGNTDDSPMQQMTGATGAAPIWRDVMNAYHSGKPVRPFPAAPAGVQRLESVNEWGIAGVDWIRKSGSEKPVLRIVKPFDQDEFEWDPHRPPEAQAIELRAEKEDSDGIVQWQVNGEAVGEGDAIFWPIRPGSFEIQASLGSADALPIHIRVK